MIINNFTIYVNSSALWVSFDCLNIRHVYYIRIFCRNICAFKWKIYNFKVGFTDFFTATVKFEKNYDLFNLKFSCIKEKQIFADAVVLMATAAVTGFAISDQSEYLWSVKCQCRSVGQRRNCYNLELYWKYWWLLCKLWYMRNIRIRQRWFKRIS